MGFVEEGIDHERSRYFEGMTDIVVLHVFDHLVNCVPKLSVVGFTCDEPLPYAAPIVDGAVVHPILFIGELDELKSVHAFHLDVEVNSPVDVEHTIPPQIRLVGAWLQRVERCQHGRLKVFLDELVTLFIVE